MNSLQKNADSDKAAFSVAANESKNNVLNPRSHLEFNYAVNACNYQYAMNAIMQSNAINLKDFFPLRQC